MSSTTMFRRVKGLIKEHVPLAKEVVQWIKPPPDPDATYGPIPRPPWMPINNLRDRYSLDFIQGSGLEIGALYNPVFVRRGVQVKYVDFEDVASLREQIRDVPEHGNDPIVNVDIIDHGDTLQSIANESQDFIIANHFLEHVQDPIGTIQRHLEVLKPGGILYYGIPDKRFTFDRERPVTTMEHFYRDHDEGPAWSLMDHLVEYVALVEHKTGIDGENRIKEMLGLRHLSIHFHVWTIHELCEFYANIRRRYSMPFDIEAIANNKPVIETLCILRKT